MLEIINEYSKIAGQNQFIAWYWQRKKYIVSEFETDLFTSGSLV